MLYLRLSLSGDNIVNGIMGYVDEKIYVMGIVKYKRNNVGGMLIGYN